MEMTIFLIHNMCWVCSGPNDNLFIAICSVTTKISSNIKAMKHFFQTK
jgi:hypothetical protein